MSIKSNQTHQGTSSPQLDPLAPWRKVPPARPLLGEQEGHSIHSYFNVCPESPDGGAAVCFVADDAEARSGRVVAVDRATGRATPLGDEVETEDAHRAACQQWTQGGRCVAYHAPMGDGWAVFLADPLTGRAEVAAGGRQIGFGDPCSSLLPLYGPHWLLDSFRDIEFLDIANRQRRTIVTAEATRQAYPEWHERTFGAKPTSLFFPIVSPCGKRVIFKIAAPGGGDFRSKAASDRRGLVCYDLAEGRFLFLRENWGHPAWSADGRSIVNLPGVLMDAETGEERPIPGFPVGRAGHPSLSPDGLLYVTDASSDGAPGPNQIVAGPLAGGDPVEISRFPRHAGACSWRPAHPHPVFSHDGRRIYFNVNEERWTRVYVAEGAFHRRGATGAENGVN